MRRHLSARPRYSLAASLSVLLLALVASDVLAPADAETVDLALCGVTVAGLLLLTALRRFYLVERLAAPREPSLRGSAQLALYLTPVILLSVAFPLATRRIEHVSVGGTTLTSLLLASSLTVPWLSQSVCLPLYRGIADLVQREDRGELERRLCRLWPVTYAQSLVVLVAFAGPVELVTHWSLEAIGAYVALGAVYIAFSQSLIIGIVAKRRVLWAIGWALFAVALLAAPSLWFLPPLVGLATQLVPLRKSLLHLARPMAMTWRDVGADMARGFLLGAVLWCDKFLYFLRDGQHWPVTDVFVALLPAILAYNYYFVRLAPVFDDNVTRLRTAMEQEPYSALGTTSRRLAQVVEASIARTALSGAVLVLATLLIVGVVTPQALPFVATVAAASWLFMMTTVLCYKLDYIGLRRRAQVISALHLVVCIAVFALAPAGIATYGVLIGAEAVLFAVALRNCVSAWGVSEYSLFWTHATAW